MRDFLKIAAAIGLQTKVRSFPLDHANDGLLYSTAQRVRRPNRSRERRRESVPAIQIPQLSTVLLKQLTIARV